MYRAVQDIHVDAGVLTYDIGLHTVYCHYSREMVHIPEPKDGTLVVFLDRSGVEEQLPKSWTAAGQVKGVGQETEVIVNKVIYRAAFH